MYRSGRRQVRSLVTLSACALIACNPDGQSTQTDTTSATTTMPTTTEATTVDTELSSDGTSESGSSTSEGETSGTSETTAGETSETSETTGVNGCPQTEEFMCEVYEIDCDQIACGTLDSPFDDDGCLREVCPGGVGCADGMTCYTPLEWGGCASSGLFCNDSELQMACICGGDADCNGSYCVPEELYPLTEFNGPGRIDNSCAPDDGPAHEFVFGLDQATCDGVFDGASLRILLHSENFGLGFEPYPPGSYPLDGNGFAFYDADDGEMPVTGELGYLQIDSWDTVVSGSYKVWVGDSVLSGSFAEIPYCEGNPMCG